MNKTILLNIHDKNKIMAIFKEIDKVLPTINKERKQMISIKFVLRKIFIMLGLPYEIFLLKKTLAFYDTYCEELYSLIGIKTIFHHIF